MVTRDGPRVFLYAGSEAEATRKPSLLPESSSPTRICPPRSPSLAGIPSPRSGRTRPSLSSRAKRGRAKRRSAVRRNASARRRRTRIYDWLVKAELASRDEAAELEDFMKVAKARRCSTALALRHGRRAHRGAGKRAWNSSAPGGA